jgi:hypothetical protein
MEQDEREDFLSIISKLHLSENDFEIKENNIYPETGIGFLSGTLTIKYKHSAFEKSYQHFGHAWLEEFWKDLKSNFYKIKAE